MLCWRLWEKRMVIDGKSLIYSIAYAVLASVLVVSILSLIYYIVGNLILGWGLRLDHYIITMKIKALVVTNLICGFGFALFVGKERLINFSMLSKFKYVVGYIVVSYLIYFPILNINTFLMQCYGNAIEPMDCLTLSLNGDIRLKLSLGINFRPINTDSALLVVGGLIVTFIVSPLLNRLSSLVGEEQ